MRLLSRTPVALALLAAASCSNGGTSTTPAVQTANIAQTAKLQFAVGTATIAYPGGTVAGTNFVATFRGPNGHSATLVNTPTISGPPSFAIGFAGSPNSLSGILPNVFNQAIQASTKPGSQWPATAFAAGLGPVIGVFGYGLAADNLLSSQVALQYVALSSEAVTCQDLNTRGNNTEQSPQIASQGTINGVQVGGNVPSSEAQSQELGLPLGNGQGTNSTSNSCPVSPLAAVPPSTSSIGQDLYPINYYGGPPAWPSPQGYGSPQFFVGYPLGFTDVAATPVAGNYSLDVAYPTNADASTYGHFDTSATLRNTQGLPPLTITNGTINSDGTGSVVMNVPPGLFEAIVLVRAADCNPAERPGAQFNNYAVVTHSTGIQSFVFSAALGPPNNAGQPTPTFCSGAATAFAVGFDYPAYESSYPFDTTQTPKITNADGHTGQADVTTSAPFTFSAATSTTPTNPAGHMRQHESHVTRHSP